MAKKRKDHIPVPKDTPAFICAECGAVSLSASSICKPQGRGRKADWCGTKSLHKPDFCHENKHNLRFRCEDCGQVSVNPELLCKPEEISQPCVVSSPGPGAFPGGDPRGSAAWRKKRMALSGVRGKGGILGFGMSPFGPNQAGQEYTHDAAIAYTRALRDRGVFLAGRCPACGHVLFRVGDRVRSVLKDQADRTGEVSDYWFVPA